MVIKNSFGYFQYDNDDSNYKGDYKMFKKPFSSNSKDKSYLDFQKIYTSVSFGEIDNSNFDKIYEQLSAYMNEHGNNKHSYELAKRFILGISVALVKQKIDLKDKNSQYGFIADRLEPAIYKDREEQRKLIFNALQNANVAFLKLEYERAKQAEPSEDILKDSVFKSLLSKPKINTEKNKKNLADSIF